MIANPYFVADEPTAKALELAALRGVDVRIILPANSDNRLVQLARQIEGPGGESAAPQIGLQGHALETAGGWQSVFNTGLGDD